MQIRVKRGGWLLLAGITVVVLSVVVRNVRSIYFRHDVSLPSVAAEEKPPISQVTTKLSPAEQEILAAASPELKNPGFEDGFKPVGAPEPGQHARVTGNLPNGWFDLSQWSDLNVHYDQDRHSPHTGSSCLRIDLGDLRDQGILLAQPLKLINGKTYTATVWLRAAQPTTVVFGLRMRGKPYSFYGLPASPRIGPVWQKVQTTGTAGYLPGDRYPFVFFLITLNSPHSTVWVDDASIVETTP